MKKQILSALIGLTIVSGSAFAAKEVHKPDQNFISVIAEAGITQENWDNGKNSKLIMKNAYRMTPHVEVSTRSNDVHRLENPVGFDLASYQGNDFDGPLSLDILMRDRLNMETVVITKDGKLIDEYYWNGTSKDSTHLQMSVTKSFTSLTASIFAAKGMIDMSKPITDYLPELKASKGFSRATVQEVADMRSGIKINFSEGLLWDDRMSNVQNWNGENKYPELKGIIDFASLVGERDDHGAGEYYDYQCTNTEMLAKVVERVTGDTMSDVFEENIWSKVGFEHDAKWMSNNDGEVIASGGLNITTRDVNRMMFVLINEGKNLKGEQIIPKKFIDNLLEGDDDVRSAWLLGKETVITNDAWYKDQIRVFNIEGHKFIAFFGIHGQITVGEPNTGIVIAMNSAQDEMEGIRAFGITLKQVIPTILKGVSAEAAK
ncbi:serine hydrolase domain-containing protein [Photobacterium profundum]|uniref:serine hydrolase domain-containing protein n=1 Tax=Photobacterium profundum TaxID=74109 RepID=UPI003D0D6E23